MLPHHPPPHHACSNLCVWCLSLSHSLSVSHSNKYELFHMGYQDNISHRLRSLSLWQSGQGKQSYMTACVCLRVFYMRARAVMSSCVGERPRDANERGQHTTRTDVLTAQFLWEPAPTHPSPSHYHQHIPPPSIAPHCSCKSLTSSSNASRFVFMRVQAFLVELSHQLQLNLSPPLPPKCACQVRVHG